MSKSIPKQQSKVRKHHPIVLTSSLRRRFWKYVAVRGPDDCWKWRGSLSRGYGVIGSGQGGVDLRAHRVAWAIEHGDPGDLYVCHHCLQPACCNPAHLFLGTHLDNMRDAAAKGRFRPPRGERQHFAKLSSRKVRAARKRREDGESYESLARRYGVTIAAIRFAVIGETWKHVK
jgi:hypothetical protein